MYQEISGIKTWIRTYGNGDKKILILHGWTHKGAHNWTEIAEEIASLGYTVCLPDLPGFGKSSEPPSIWGVTDYAHWAKDLIESTGWSHYTLAGHSFGGGISSIMADKNIAIDRLVLVSPAIVRNTAKTRYPFISSRIKKILTGYLGRFRPFAARIWRRLTGSPDYARTSTRMASIMRRVIKEDLVSYLQYISVPTYLIWGDQDTYTPIVDAETVLKHIPDTTFIKLEGINHGVHLHAREKLVSILTDQYYA